MMIDTSAGFTHKLGFLYLGFGSLTVAFVLLALFATRGITNAHSELLEITRHNEQQARNAMLMRVAVRERSILLWHMMQTADVFERDELLQKFLEYGSQFGKARLDLENSSLANDENVLLDSVDVETRNRAPVLREFANLMMEEKGHITYEQRLDQAISEQVIVADLLDDLIAYQHDENENANSQNAEVISNILAWLIAGMVIIITLSILFAKLVVRQAHRQIFALKETQKQLGEANDELKLLARHDHLTGLPNRLYLLEHLETTLGLVRRHGQRAAVLYIDLDGFKAINDSYGHEVGDVFLTAISQRMQKQLRETDLLARLGGDEFVVLLTDMAQESEATMVAQKLLDTLASEFRLGRHLVLQASASIGICCLPTTEVGKDNIEQVLDCADQAMYKAKTSGKNCFHINCDAQPLRVAK